MIGALERFCLSFIVLATCLLAAGISRAEEFGNILLPSTEQASRQASARALNAAGLMISGFQRRELRQSESASETFRSALREFQAAASAMEDILKRSEASPELRDFFQTEVPLYKALPEQEVNGFVYWLRRGKVPVEGGVVKKEHVFQVLISETRDFSGAAEQMISQKDKATSRKILDDVGFYISMGTRAAKVMDFYLRL